MVQNAACWKTSTLQKTNSAMDILLSVFQNIFRIATYLQNIYAKTLAYAMCLFLCVDFICVNALRSFNNKISLIYSKWSVHLKTPKLTVNLVDTRKQRHFNETHENFFRFLKFSLTTLNMFVLHREVNFI